MIHTVALLTTDEVADLRSRLAGMRWSDGANTASGQAGDTKRNTQTSAADPAATELHRELESRLVHHEQVDRIAMPRAVVGTRFNRYGVGDRYGLHVDRTLMAGHRTDLSFTVLLSEPDEYDGGELRIAAGSPSPRLKPPAGSVVLYPTHLLHEVTPVTRGERLGFVGWIESWVPDAELRDAVGKIRSLRATLGDHPAGAVARLQIDELEQTLIRLGTR